MLSDLAGDSVGEVRSAGGRCDQLEQFEYQPGENRGSRLRSQLPADGLQPRTGLLGR